MGKSGNKELAKAITDKFSLDKADAERFVQQMFEVLGDGLQSDRQVKIKGLGTFKMLSVAPRKSVDVNTGEPITIEGRDKISFTPDASLRDKVNAPFAQFETVVINDGVDFSEIDKEFDEKEEPATDESSVKEKPVATEEVLPSEEELPAVKETTVQEETPAEENTSAKEESSAEEEVLTEEAETSAKNEEPSPKQDEPVQEGLPVREGEAAQKTVSAEENPSLEEAEEKSFLEETEEKSSIEDLKEKLTTEESEEVPSTAETGEDEAPRRPFYKWLIAAVVAVVLIFGGAVYYFVHQIQLRDNRIQHLETVVINSKANKPVSKKKQPLLTENVQPQKPMDAAPKQSGEYEVTIEQHLDNPVSQRHVAEKENASNASNAESKALAFVAKDVRADEAKRTPNDKARKAQVSDPKEAQSATPDYNKDVRVRTGAYTIVGVDKTVTFRAGQTLEGISKAYFGPGMECYVEAVNGGRTSFKAGDKINIPKLKVKKRKH